MSRYIDADKLKDLITEIDGGCANEKTGFDIYTCEVFDLIDETPTADVRENVKGKWINISYFDSGYKQNKTCSKCKKTVSGDVFDYNFCPHCGADMRGEV